MKFSFRQLSLAQQFLVISVPILLLGCLIIGRWTAVHVGRSVVMRGAADSVLYVESFVKPHVQKTAGGAMLSEQDMDLLRRLAKRYKAGQSLVALRVWRSDGLLLFSTDAGAIGKIYPPSAGLRAALQGRIQSEITDFQSTDASAHGHPGYRVIETYTPIFQQDSDKVLAVAEFYEDAAALEREVDGALWVSWLLVCATMLAMGASLFLVVRKAGNTIAVQRTKLKMQVHELRQANIHNADLAATVVVAARQASDITENFLQRFAADIHDGPGQDLGFALMQIRGLIDLDTHGAPNGDAKKQATLVQVEHAVQSALKDLRAMSADMNLPNLDRLNTDEVAWRAVHDFQQKTGCAVQFTPDLRPAAADITVKVTLYRLLQESLANTFRHAQGKDVTVALQCVADRLHVRVSDGGPGFSWPLVMDKGRLGLRGMRQRVEVLGGVFAVRCDAGMGTRIEVTLPLNTKASYKD